MDHLDGRVLLEAGEKHSFLILKNLSLETTASLGR